MSKRGQKVLSYVIFHRHGQRAPTKNIYEASHTTPHHAPHRPLAETETWQELLAPAHKLDSLQELYPVRRHPQRELQSDLNTKPFGCLTSTGLDHLEDKGRATREAFPALVDVTNFNVFATNYQRTQASAQAFLKGLGAPPGTPVEVLAGEDCPLSFYDHDPDLAVKLTKQVQSTSTFQKEESSFVDSHGEHLMGALPELGTARDVFTFNIPLDDSATPSSDQGATGVAENEREKEKKKSHKINWMAALDYFACRNAHQLPLHPELQEERFGSNVKEYVGSRFSLYYADRDMRRMAVLPMLSSVVLKEFTQHMGAGQRQGTVASSQADMEIELDRNRDVAAAQSPTAVIYSGHDVNLLGLLVTLNSSVVKSTSNSSKGHWPDYGASLVFELVEVNEGEGEPVDRDSSLLVNVFYNHQPLNFELPGSAAEVGHSIPLKNLIAFCEKL